MTDLFQREAKVVPSGPVTCLGLEFSSDEERRSYFTAKLREKLRDPAFRKIEGFPIGTDEDILTLSDPPYYTACPNPFITDFVRFYGKTYDPATDAYHREPFAADVSEGKRDPIYEHYSYHTKVPHKAIARYIAHYTDPGDVIVDSFSGSGMTGVAGKFLVNPESGTGERHVIANDISPYATFISHHFNECGEVTNLRDEFEQVSQDHRWMYETRDSDGISRAINYIVWSDVFLCPQCGCEVVFFDQFVNQTTGEVLSSGLCGSCKVQLTKQALQSNWVTEFDELLGRPIKIQKQIPVLINFFIGRSAVFKRPDGFDFELLSRIQQTNISSPVPIFELPEGDNTSQPITSHGITHTHRFFTKRNLIAVSLLVEVANRAASTFWLFEILGGFRVWTKRSIFLTSAWKEGGTGPFKPSTTGILYVPSISGERNVFHSFRQRYDKSLNFKASLPRGETPFVVSTGSSTDLKTVPSNSADYVFVDPPFGGNLMYSELNLVFEPWLHILTNTQSEAICNKTQKKGVTEYSNLMASCFKEIHRLLKPGRWVTVEFHNSFNVIWTAIQESMQMAGLVIADVRILDKKQGTFKQYTSAGTVKKDLIISAYKPNGGLEDRFKLEAGTEEGVWDFVRTHLKQLPVFVAQGGQAEVIAERQHYLLFDRMVAFHVQRGVTIPLSATEYYKGLDQRFSMRDGMYYLPDQAAEYDKKRMSVSDVLQLQLFVTDESSAIQWLKQQLLKKPQTFQEIHPQFMKEIGGWQKHEKALELLDLLGQNFLRYDGISEVPSQIHSYLSTNFKELRSLAKDEATLRSKAKDRWYVPDPNKAGDLEKLRDRALLREFWEYLPPGYKPVETPSLEGYIPGLEPKAPAIAKGKKMKVIRLEAVRTGFKYCWQIRDYRTIIAVAQRIPEEVLQEDPKLLMWYDQAVTRTGGK